ncbi:MAG: DUF421 domain-containing protein [Flavobacterium sp.]|nr:DUF421 domain-containing protein [Pedobacter sp.]
MDSTLEIILRTSSVYLFLIVAIRLFGKKELSQLSTTDLVFIVLISNAVQNAMVGANTSLYGGIVAASVLFIMTYILKLIIYRYPKLRDFIETKAVILVHNGKLNVDHLHQESISMDELEQAIREHGVDSYKKVVLAVLEIDGNISVISGDDNKLKQTSHKTRRKRKDLTRMS